MCDNSIHVQLPPHLLIEGDSLTPNKNLLTQVWNDNAGDKKPSPDVLIGKAPLPVEHLALASPAALSGTTGGNGGDGGGGSRDNNTDDERGGKRVVLTVALVPSNGRTRKGKNAPGGVVTLTLAYTPPR